VKESKLDLNLSGKRIAATVPVPLFVTLRGGNEVRVMLEHTILYVVVENDAQRVIHAVRATVEEAEEARTEVLATLRSPQAPWLCDAELSIHAMNAVFPGDRFRLVYGEPVSLPSHPLEVPVFRHCKVTNTDAHSEGYAYPDDLYLFRKQAFAVAALHNAKQLERQGSDPLEWAVVVEIGEPLWRRCRSECLVSMGVGWEQTDSVRPVRVIRPTVDEVAADGAAAADDGLPPG
jgi:hypothetical protein